MFVNPALVLLPMALVFIGWLAHITFMIHDLEESTAKYTPHNTIILFDIHGVLFKPDYKKFFSLLVRNKKTVLLILYSLHPGLLIDLITLWRSGAIVEHYFLVITKKYTRLSSCLPLMIALANAQKPIKQSVNLVAHLKARGYSLHILSNIGKQIFDNLAQQHQSLFSHFDVIKVAQADDTLYRKPHATIYHQYQSDHNPHAKNIIFIDDKKKNIKAAQKFGFIALFYHSATALEQQLLPLLQE